MPLFVLGINHKTASIAIRERLVFSPESIDYALQSLHQNPLIDGCVILSTCNRSEIYCSFTLSDEEYASNLLKHWWINYHHLQKEEIHSHFYFYSHDQAVQHLMGVACGLDSLVLGEPQILGQVKTAYSYAQMNNTLDLALERLFHKSFSVAKRVRTETMIGASPVSVAFAACSLAKQLFSSPGDVTVLLVGAGETIELVAQYLKQHKVNKLIIANRTLKKAQQLVLDSNFEAIVLTDLPNKLHEADIIISSTASPLPIIGKGMVERSLKKRINKPVLMIDIAVPRDIEEEVASLENVHLYTVDDLHVIIQQNLAQRKMAAKEAQYIISQACVEFMTWLRSQKAVNSIRDFRNNMENIRQNLVNESLMAIGNGKSPQKVIDELSQKLTNRLIHLPTQLLYDAASEEQPLNFLWLKSHLGLK